MPTSSTQAAEPLVSDAVRTKVPATAYFATSAVFHYLGPSFAVLLFARVEPLGVAWLRITTAGLVFAVWRRPWLTWRRAGVEDRRTVVAFGLVLAAMNALFYLAIDRLPLGTVGAIEFGGTVMVAAVGVRTRRNRAALGLAVAGVVLLTHVRWASEPLGFVFAFGNCVLFMLYVVLGHAAANRGGDGGGSADRGRDRLSGVDRLAAAMVVASVAVLPLGIVEAAPACTDWRLLAAGAAVGVCSSVIPYVCDQLAMARLPRATFALFLALLPAVATVVGLVVLGQVPTPLEAAGVALVVVAVALHEQPAGPAQAKPLLMHDREVRNRPRRPVR